MTERLRGATPPSGGVVVLALASLLLAGCADSPEPPRCDDPTVPLTDIQGGGDASPRRGETLDIEGVVTGSVTTRSRTGVFIQQPGHDDPSRSGALFVVLGEGEDLPPTGRRIHARGVVREIEGLTSLAAGHWNDCGTGPDIEPATVRLGQDLEPYEGMRVTIEDPTTVTDAYAAGWGDLTVSARGRLWQATEHASPGEAARLAEQQAAASELLIRLPGRAPALRVGDRVSKLAGILDQDGSFRLLARTMPRVEALNPRPPPLQRTPGSLRMAAVNLLNFFNGDGRGGGFPTPRGAADADELSRQQGKLVTAMRLLDADLLALAEVENDGYGPDSAMAQLSAALAEASGRDYRPVRLVNARPGTDDIAVGMIYDHDRIQPRGPASTLVSPPFHDLNRAPLMQRFAGADGQSLNVVAVHLKSKTCTNAEGPNRAQGDGQVCWNPVRVAAVEALADWVEASGLGDETVFIGDFNAYSREDPVATMIARGFDRLHPAERDYSFIFRGRSGSMDHAFAAPALARRALQVQHWHINADEPARVDYRDHQSDPDSPYRSSDHDPLVVDLDWPGSG